MASPAGLAHLLQASLQGLAPWVLVGGPGWRHFQVTRTKVLSCCELPAGQGQQGKEETSLRDMQATLLGSVLPKFLGRVSFPKDKVDSGDGRPVGAAQPHHTPTPWLFLNAIVPQFLPLYNGDNNNVPNS